VIAQCGEPFLHALLLVLVLALAVALVDVSLAPLTVTSSDLFDAAERIRFVVSHESLLIVETAIGFIAGGIASHAGFAIGAQLWVWVWATVGLVVGVEVTADVTAEGSAHSVSITLEFLLPALEGRKVRNIVVEPLMRELDQPIQTLFGCSWWNFLVLGGGGGCEDDCCDFHDCCWGFVGKSLLSSF